MLASLIRILLPFFSWPYLPLFVEMQKLTGLLISGSAALSFFNDQFYCSSDLDLYVDFDRRDAALEFLLKAGYQYKPRPDQDPKLENAALLRSSRLATFPTHTTTVTFAVQSDYSGKTIMAVLNFQRPGHENVVQVILTRGTLVRCILEFHSTCVMNFISAWHAISLYPLATFVHRSSALSQRIARYQQSHLIIKKYQSRGFTFLDGGDLYNDLFFPEVCRWVGDTHSWVVPLQPDGEVVSGIEDESYHPIMSNTWRLVDCTRDRGYWIDTGFMHSVNMDESYCIASTLIPLIYAEGDIWDDENIHSTMTTIVRD